MKKLFILFLIFSGWCFEITAQNLIYVDKEGVIRWTKDNKEASFFGVNYTVPFAYGYRSHKALGKDLKKSIEEDVYHLARLGLDGFRVHMWDVEISDSAGNLLENDHLDLFDYLIFKLQQKNIYSLITPIAFWGNGYPERDDKTPGFSTVYGKGPAVVKEEAIKAQENYLKQLMNHVNPYTKKTYRDDAMIIALEINNEPHHSGPKEKTTEYINRLAAAVRGSGWTKPVFYNISESPTYSDAVAKAKVEGHSFQWYPSGLVAGHEQKGNFLPHVDRYPIPFDSIAQFRNKAKMVYEFDAADIMQPIMYPAMARSYRTAGFQWATQFAYDPLATAYANTEYQTHYLNLIYTPSKAISLLIASKVFHTLPRMKSYGSYPGDTSFDVFRISYKEQLSEMNSEEEFYYSNSTRTYPKNINRLKHLAGVGNSKLVEYAGSGSYFLDKINDQTWKLEIMPDAIQVADPFAKASPNKEVTRIEYRSNYMAINLPSLNFNGYLSPGVYTFTNGKITGDVQTEPVSMSTNIALLHKPIIEVTEGKAFQVKIKLAGTDTADKINLELRSVPRWRTIAFQREGAGKYFAEIPADAVVPGILSYRVIIQRPGNEYFVFPGNYKGDPFAWDNTNNETYQTIVSAKSSALELFNTNTDRNNLIQYNTDWRNNFVRIIPGSRSTQLALQLFAKATDKAPLMAWQFFAGDKMQGRISELDSFRFLVVKCRSENISFAKITLVSKDAGVYSSNLVAGTQWDLVRIRLSDLKPDSLLLLPRPYPGFLPLWFKPSPGGKFSLSEVESIQFILEGRGGRKEEMKKEEDFAIESVWLEK